MSSLVKLTSRLRLPLVTLAHVRRPLAVQASTSGRSEPSSRDLPSDLRQPQDPTVMPVIDPAELGSITSEAEQLYIKRFEERHIKNVQRRQRERRRARVIGLSFGALVIAIYIYTIKRVRQETFLDDFTIPEPPPQKKAIEHE